MKRLAATALALLLALVLSVPAFAAGPEVNVFYQQLSFTAQQIFDRLNSTENLAKFRSGATIEMYFTAAYSSQAEREQEFRRYLNAVVDAYTAFLTVHPEYFWLSVTSPDGGMSQKYNGSRLDLMARIIPRFRTEWSIGSRSVYADEATVNAAVKKLAQEAKTQGGIYERLLYVHDWLIHHNHFNYSASGSDPEVDCLPWTPLSALTDVSQPVCMGYASAFKMVYDELSIPCLLVTGTAVHPDGSGGNHAWNQVLIGGEWYAVDVTYDDPSSRGDTNVISGHEKRDYFLVGAQTKVQGNGVFSDNHLPTEVVAITTNFTYPAISSMAYDPDKPFQFADVSDSAYYSEAVQWAVGVGVTNGTGTDSKGVPLFSPNSTVTRGQAVTFLWRAMWEPEPETTRNPFRDVKNGDYYYDAVLWAVENGITNGTGAATFSPGDPVTRGQMLTFLWRTLGKPGETGNYSGKQWYEDAENWGEESGCIYGTAQPYSTNAKCPRSDVVFYLWQAMMSLPD